MNSQKENNNIIQQKRKEREKAEAKGKNYNIV